MKLWKFNKITGYWVFQRDCTNETASRWLKLFQNDEPGEFFKLSKNKPSKPPYKNRV
jgi:hypothetical protein